MGKTIRRLPQLRRIFNEILTPREAHYSMKKIKMLKDYKQFKAGQYLEFPSERFTGQIQLANIWKEIDRLVDEDFAVYEQYV